MLISGIGRRTVHKRTGSTGIRPSFSLPLLDAGAGAVNLVPMIALGSGTPTFTRATTAWTKLSTGLWAAVGTGVARSSYLGMNTAVGSYGGYLAEGARTNLLLQSNDMTNVAWVATTMSTAKTSIGPDGAANSATRITASGNLATILQLYVAAASDRTYSAWIRRVTGTGTIKLFQGATKSADLAASLNTVTYTQVQLDATVDVTLTGVGIEIGTNTDAIDVWCNQFEAGAFASTPIPTTTIAVARNADVLTYPTSGNISNTVGTMYAESFVTSIGKSGGVSVGGDAVTNRQFLRLESSVLLRAYDGTFNPTLSTGPFSSGVVYKLAQTWSGSAMLGSSNGSTPAGGSFSGNYGLTTTFGVGVNSGVPMDGGIKNLRIYSVALSSAQLQAMTT